MKSEKRLYRGDSKENRLLIRQPILYYFSILYTTFTSPNSFHFPFLASGRLLTLANKLESLLKREASQGFCASTHPFW